MKRLMLTLTTLAFAFAPLSSFGADEPKPAKDHKNSKECLACCKSADKCDACCHDKGKGKECEECCGKPKPK